VSGEQVERAYLDTPIGTMLIEVSPSGLRFIDLVSEPNGVGDLAEIGNPVLAEAVRQLEQYFAGERRQFDLPLDLEAGEFERRVLDELASVPYGSTVSYGEMAARAGYPGAARAVGNVMRTNSLMIVLPCHRVIGADGTLRGYGGLGNGLDHKRWLLAFESTSGASLQ
jgi:methylated-DNA-[protein]-cysteine S-methyltransferase